jgi:Ca-activated chloride channel family protein
MFALLPAALLSWWLLPAYREERESLRIPFFERISSAVAVRPQKGGVVLRRNVVQMALASLAWVLIVSALARPQFVEPPIEKTESARDLLLSVDLSGSMATRDMLDPDGERIDRLAAVQSVLDDFIARREGDRIGLSVFGDQAFLLAPFTQDHSLVRAMLEQTKARMAGSQTMLGDAIGLAIQVFENSEAEDRLLVLLTDGNDSGSRVPPRNAAEIAARHDVTIHTIAVGDPTTTGESEMDTETLLEVSGLTGGQFFRADDRAELETIYQRIDDLTPIEVETISFRPTRPLFHWPLGGAVVLMLLYHVLMAIAQAARSRGVRHA